MVPMCGFCRGTTVLSWPPRLFRKALLLASLLAPLLPPSLPISLSLSLALSLPLSGERRARGSMGDPMPSDTDRHERSWRLRGSLETDQPHPQANSHAGSGARVQAA